MSLRARIEAARIDVREATELTGQVDRPEGCDPGTRSFSVTLVNGLGETLTVPWHIGPKSDAYPNEPDNVLDCLLSDAAGIENAGSFEEWASEYDYDIDSRKAEAMYNEGVRDAARLRDFLGDEADAFLWETDRL
jgi:hypothetical protein